MAKNFLKKLTSKKKKSTSKSDKKGSTGPAPTNPMPLPVIGRHRTTSGAPQSTRSRSSVTIGANRTPQPPPLTTLQKWSPGTKSESPRPGPALIGRGRGSSAPKPSPSPGPEDEKAPYTANYSYTSPGTNLFEDDKDSGPYNNYARYGSPESEKAPYTANYSYTSPGTNLFEDDKDSGPYNNYGGGNAPYKVTEFDVEDEAPKGKYGTREEIAAMLEAEDDKDSGPYNNYGGGNAPYKVTEFDVEDEAPKGKYGTREEIAAMLEAEDDKDSGPYNNYGGNAPYKVTEFDVEDEAPKGKYGTREEIAAMLEADDDSDYDSEDDDDILYQNLDDGPEQKQDVAPQPPLSSAAKDSPAVRTHRAWLVAQLSKDYEHERSVQRGDLTKAATGLANEIKLWWDLIEELGLVVESEPDELVTALGDAPDGHPIRDLTNLADAIEMAKKVHANKLEMARRQELPVTEEGELGDISARLVQYDDQAAQERSLVLVGGSKLFRNDDKKTPVDTKQSSTFHSGLGAEIFVVGMGNDIHMASHKIGKFHHSSLLGGATVSMAGEMQVTDGKIDWLSNKSGHYTPSVVQFQQFLHHLGKDVPLNFPVLGWGVPKGVTAQQLVDGVGEDGQLKEKRSHDYQKTQALLTAWKDLVGKDAMKKVMKAKGWKLDKWDGEWEVEDANYQAIPPQSVRQAMKDAYPDKKPVGEK